MLSLKVDNQASLPNPHVYSEWGLSPSFRGSSIVPPLSSSLELVVEKNLHIESCIEENVHNNTIPFTVGSAQMASYTPIEDKLYVSESDNLYAIFDGHGGDICSRFIVDRVPKQLLSALNGRKAITEAEYTSTIKQTFSRVDEQFLNEHKLLVKTSASGSCGVTVLVRNDSLIIGNLGDSRVLLGSKTNVWSHELLTNDHNTKNEKERQLVKQRTTDPMPIRGHVTNKVHGERIGGILMVTRAFGDGIFKRKDMSLAPFIPHLPYITNEPEVTIRKLSPYDRYAIISSDGLYEYLTPTDVAATVEKQLEITRDGTKIAAALIELQFEKVAKLAGKTVEQVKAIPKRKEFLDDTTVIVLVFNQPQPLFGGGATL